MRISLFSLNSRSAQLPCVLAECLVTPNALWIGKKGLGGDLLIYRDRREWGKECRNYLYGRKSHGGKAAERELLQAEYGRESIGH